MAPVGAAGIGAVNPSSIYIAFRKSAVRAE